MSPSQAQTLPDMWLDPDDDPRAADEIEVVDERTNLLEYLRVYRLTLRMKCDGLTPEQLARQSVPPSTMSLLGLVRHLAKVERDWFRLRGAQEDAPRLYWSEADRDEAFAHWDEDVAYGQRFVAAEPDLGRVYTYRDGETISLRELLLHMVEEYARHCGHADLLRECVDGRTGQ